MGLQLEERKRRRSESKAVANMDIVMGQHGTGPSNENFRKEAVFSNGDLAASKGNSLAELAMQASRTL